MYVGYCVMVSYQMEMLFLVYFRQIVVCCILTKRVQCLAHFDAIAMNNGKEFGAGFGIAFKTSPHTTRRGGGTHFLNPPHDHAKMIAFHDYCHTEGFDGLHNGISNLSRQTFLDL